MKTNKSTEKKITKKQKRTINTLMGIKCITQLNEMIKTDGVLFSVVIAMERFCCGNVIAAHLSTKVLLDRHRLEWCNRLHDKHSLSNNFTAIFVEFWTFFEWRGRDLSRTDPSECRRVWEFLVFLQFLNAISMNILSIKNKQTILL